MSTGGVKNFYRQKKKGGVGKAASSSKPSKAAALALATIATEKVAASASFDEEEDQKLRRFDLDMRYGPCIGLSRAARWDRAVAMGLNPPADVQTILAKSAEAAADCIWSGRV